MPVKEECLVVEEDMLTIDVQDIGWYTLSIVIPVKEQRLVIGRNMSTIDVKEIAPDARVS